MLLFAVICFCLLCPGAASGDGSIKVCSWASVVVAAWFCSARVLLSRGSILGSASGDGSIKVSQQCFCCRALILSAGLLLSRAAAQPWLHALCGGAWMLRRRLPTALGPTAASYHSHDSVMC